LNLPTDVLSAKLSRIFTISKLRSKSTASALEYASLPRLADFHFHSLCAVIFQRLIAFVFKYVHTYHEFADWHNACSGFWFPEINLSYCNAMSHLEKKQWYVIYTKPQQDECAQFHLRAKGIEAFFPRLLLPKFSRKRNRIVPLFPNYLFVRIYLEKEYDYVRWSPGVKYFVSFSDTPVPLDDSIVEYLIRQADSVGLISARADLQVGQEIRITGGPFDGSLGLIQKIPDARGRVKILMQLLSRKLVVEVPTHFIDSGWVLDPTRPAAARLAVNKFQLPVTV
jgi:transcriptional antiterminator RfaH